MGLKKQYIVVVSAVIFNKENKILILKRSDDEDVLPGYYGVPGGKVEEGPNTPDVLSVAIKREISEEVGIEIDNLEIFDSHIGIDDGKIHIYFRCKHLSGEPMPLEDTASVYWMNLEEISSLEKKTPNLYENCVKANNFKLGKIQNKVKNFTEENNMNSPTEFRVLDLVSEVGEVSKEILKMTDYGNKKLELNENIKSELGDVFFSLVTVANSLEINLEEALEMVLEKYQKRISKGGNSGSENN